MRKLHYKKNTKNLNIGIRVGKKYKNHVINITYGKSNNIVELKDYESKYLMSVSIDKAFEYLNKINNNDRTLTFLVNKYKLNQKEDVQTFLVLISDKNKRDLLENNLINQLSTNERTEYIKNYLQKKDKKVIRIQKKVPEVKVDTKKQQMLDNLQKKLEKMKIEKDILSNQYKIEQRNRLLQSRDRIVQRRDIENINNRIKKVDKMIVDANKD